MTLNELFAIQEADWFLTEWNHIRNTKVKREI